MEYESFFFDTKEEVEKILANGSNEEVVSAIIGAVNGIDDGQWLQELCLRFCNHRDFWVSKAAINGFGDIARIHKYLEKSRVLQALNSIDNERLVPIIKQTIQDIELFVS
ncbi:MULTISPECIES: hypothetical protein [unclassified Flavobacterium]|uniref:hypothetical protein n=1 Tax=unclassified Flavobacterium TaxID=196869 RepID=UPI001F12DD49|nr:MULTISPECIES: hypothetical protein [unclassified Flavobacterium]UMY66012.1 hypothetical protein MKO97_01130 [Flavobacterium sp. HJ-32-4]